MVMDQVYVTVKTVRRGKIVSWVCSLVDITWSTSGRGNRSTNTQESYVFVNLLVNLPNGRFHGVLRRSVIMVVSGLWSCTKQLFLIFR